MYKYCNTYLFSTLQNRSTECFKAALYDKTHIRDLAFYPDVDSLCSTQLIPVPSPHLHVLLVTRGTYVLKRHAEVLLYKSQTHNLLIFDHFEVVILFPKGYVIFSTYNQFTINFISQHCSVIYTLTSVILKIPFLSLRVLKQCFQTVKCMQC